MLIYIKVVSAMVLLSGSLCFGVEFVDAAFLGQARPGLTPVVFAPGIVSVQGRYEAGVTFTPDGLECCVTVTDASWSTGRIDYMQYTDGQWSTPSRAYFTPSGTANAACNFSPDGLKFFFLSMRTGNQDLWMSQRASIQDGWSAASLIPNPVSHPSAREFTPSATLDGTLYFYSSHRTGGYGGNDIWRSPYVNGQYSTVEDIGPPVNDSHDQSTPFIAPDESYLIFSVIGLPDSYGSHDLYISFRDPNDIWTIPRNLGSKINTEYNEADPYVSIDGKYFFFTRRTSSDAAIYWVDTAAFMPDPNGPIENLSSGEKFGHIQQAIDYADVGDQIQLEPGIYQEDIAIDKNVAVTSVDPNDPYTIGSTIILGSADSPVITLGPRAQVCELAGLTVRAGLVGIQGTATNATIRNCRIIDNAEHGLELSHGSNPHLDHCLITANGQTGITMIDYTSGRSVTYCMPVIENCVIVDNGSAAIVGGEPIIIDSIISESTRL